jgi:FtsH-binding integral membrane protein
MTDPQRRTSDTETAENRKRVAAWVAITLLGIAVGLSVWLAILASSGDFVNDPNLDDPKLLTPWAVALWFMKRGEALTAIFGSFLAIVTAAVGFASDLYKRRSQIAVLAFLCLLGIGACVMAMVWLDDDANLGQIVYYGNLADVAAAETRSNWFFGSLIGWFTTFLGAQLGLSAARPTGSVRRMLGGSSPPEKRPNTDDEKEDGA